MASKKGNIILTMILASLLSASFAGGHRKFMNKSTIDMEEVAKESLRKFPDIEGACVHSRVLVVKTNDYGRYNPTPKLSKPHFKLIPN